MAERSFIELEMSLATAVRTYLLAEQNERISEDENLRPVCRWLAPLLASLLRSADGWSQYTWVDSVIPCTAERVLPNDLVFSGLLIWIGGRKSSEWKEPLLAVLHLSGDSPARLNYQLRLGDADRGLGKCPYGTSHDFPAVPVENWLFTFVSQDLAE